MSRLDDMARRDAAYDLARVRAAQPKGPGECASCLRDARARFPVLVGCLDRISVDYCCAPCAMQSPDPDERQWCIWRPTRAEAERYLIERTREP